MKTTDEPPLRAVDSDWFIRWCFKQHDEVCNQKYGDGLPYSFHLKAVIAQTEKFQHLTVWNPWTVQAVAAGHDLIEDARVTYNDVKAKSNTIVADAIYACTEEKGRSRAERKSDNFYVALRQNDLAVFVKLCDVMANSLYSTLTNSSMLKKQKEEWPEIKDYLLVNNIMYKPMFNYLDKIYDL
jgi:(p)ppGpp synthase/HD superfamily hydrolase